MTTDKGLYIGWGLPEWLSAPWQIPPLSKVSRIRPRSHILRLCCIKYSIISRLDTQATHKNATTYRLRVPWRSDFHWKHCWDFWAVRGGRLKPSPDTQRSHSPKTGLKSLNAETECGIGNIRNVRINVGPKWFYIHVMCTIYDLHFWSDNI